MVGTLTLSRGQVAIVDDADFARASAFKWFAKPSRQADERYYAGRTGRKGEPTFVYLHRFILGAPDGLFVDHINGDGLDNRRENLRLCTARQNSINRAYAASSTGFRGVQQCSDSTAKWRVLFENDGITYRMGGFASPEMAARAYDALAKEFHGQFAVLNYPAPTPQSEASA